MARKFTIWGKEYEVAEKLTLGETADVEEICGGSTGENREMRRTLAGIWIAVRRIDPTAKLNDIRNLDWDDIEWVNDDPEADGASSPETDGSRSSSESTDSDPGSSETSPPTSGTPLSATSGA